MAARGGCDCYLVGLVWFGLMLAGGIIGGAERVSLKVSDPRKDLVDKYHSAVTDWDGGARDKFKKEVTPTPTVLVGSKAATEVDGLSSGDIAVPPLKDSLKSVQGKAAKLPLNAFSLSSLLEVTLVSTSRGLSGIVRLWQI